MNWKFDKRIASMALLLMVLFSVGRWWSYRPAPSVSKSLTAPLRVQPVRPIIGLSSADQKAMAEAGIPAGPVTFADDPFDTFYSYFESQGKSPPAMQVTTDQAALRSSQQLKADAHLWARQLRLVSRRLQKRNLRITELSTEEQLLCRKLFHCAVHNFKPLEYARTSSALEADASIRFYTTQSGHELIDIVNGTRTAGFSAVLF